MKRVIVVAVLGAMLSMSACQRTSSQCQGAADNIKEKAHAVWRKTSQREPNAAERALQKRFVAETVQLCVADKWAPEVVGCLQTAEDLDALTTCWSRLSDEQEAHYYAAMRKARP